VRQLAESAGGQQVYGAPRRPGRWPGSSSTSAPEMARAGENGTQAIAKQRGGGHGRVAGRFACWPGRHSSHRARSWGSGHRSPPGGGCGRHAAASRVEHMGGIEIARPVR